MSPPPMTDQIRVDSLPFGWMTLSVKCTGSYNSCWDEAAVQTVVLFIAFSSLSHFLFSYYCFLGSPSRYTTCTPNLQGEPKLKHTSSGRHTRKKY